MTATADQETMALGECLTGLAAKIEAYATEVADRAYRAGVTARQHEPEALALASLEALGDAD